MAAVVGLGVTVTAAPRAGDKDALAAWHALAPVWNTWPQQRRTIPHDRERAMASALLRGGNFACPATNQAPPECEQTFPAKAPTPNAGFDDPCMRRVLLTWALRMLSEDELAEIRDDLLPLMTLPAPEADLVTETIRRVMLVDREAAVPLLVAAGTARTIRPTAFMAELTKLSPASQAKVRAAHLYKEALDWKPDLEAGWMLEEANDPHVDSDERVWALRRLADGNPPPQVRAEIAKLVADPDCKVAMGAAAVLANLGDPRHLPNRLRTADPTANARRICMSSHEMAYLSPSSAATTKQLLASYDAGATPELIRCDGTRCLLANKTANLELTGAPDGGVRLVALHLTTSTCPSYDVRAIDDYDFERPDSEDEP